MNLESNPLPHRSKHKPWPSPILPLIISIGMILGLAPTPVSNASVDSPETPWTESSVESDIVTRVEVVPGYSLQGATVPASTPYRDNAWVAYYPITKAPTGSHTWEVWSCNDPIDGLPTLTPAQFISHYGTAATAWFTHVSGGRYNPRFVAKGSFTPQSSCTYESPPGSSGDRVMITGGCCGLGGPGGLLISSNGLELVDGTRTAEVGTSSSGHILTILIHEMGHGLGWPHIPADLKDGGSLSDYNNLADVMSGGEVTGVAAAPTAIFNLYASGWLSQSDIAVWEQGTSSFRLRVPQAGGTKLLIVPSGVQGRFHTIEVTPQTVSSPAPQGILVHSVDQTSTQSGGYCIGGKACFLTRRVTQALVKPGTPTDFADRVDPVLTAGDSLTVGTWTIEVVSAHGDGFTVELTGKGGKAPKQQPLSTFEDVPANHTFAAAIDSLAAAGITKGCNPSQGNTRFCPDEPVTRGQMAAFLVRALGLPGYNGPDRFSDDNGHTFEANIEALARAGVTRGCNPSQGNTRFCPNDHVTRGQMAAFLVRALSLPSYNGADLFTDDNGNTFEAAIESLASADITRGCNPSQGNTRFCPNDPVTRGQMAAFLVRAGLTD